MRRMFSGSPFLCRIVNCGQLAFSGSSVPRKRSGGNVALLAELLGIAQICSSWVRCSHWPRSGSQTPAEDIRFYGVVRYAPIGSTTGCPLLACGSITDYNERGEKRRGTDSMTPQGYGEQSGQAWHEGAELYRLLAENSTDLISKHTSEGVYTYASPACRSLLGYEPEELVGHSAYEFVHPDDLERTRTAHPLIPRHPATSTVRYRIRRKDGSYVWFETTTRGVLQPGTDDLVETIAVSRDITDRKRVEAKLRESQEALRKSEQFHRFAVEAGRIGTWDLDLRTDECLVSPRMAQLMGYPRDQTTVPGPQWQESIIPKDRTSMARALAATIEDDAPFELEFRVALNDGKER